MSGADEWAGRLRERVAIGRPDPARDAIGAATDRWTAIGTAWAAIAPAGSGPAEAGGARAALPVWKVELRDRDLLPGDRLTWRGGAMIVRSVQRDPTRGDRLVAIGEERR